MTVDDWSEGRDGGQMLEMRPNCENCDCDLPPESISARICSFECTFCAGCADGPLRGVCPNCTGELIARPTRPSSLVAAAPPGRDRVHSPVDIDAHRAMLAERSPGPDHAGVTIRRYAAAWAGGDLDTLLACYGAGFTIHYGGSSPHAGTYQGREAAIAAMAKVSEVAARELLSVDEVLLGDDSGALVVTERLSRDGSSIDVGRTFQYRVRDGELTECRLLEHDRAAVDRMWR